MNDGKQQDRLSRRISDLAPLVMRASTGCQEAFAELVRRHQDMAVGYAFALLRDYPSAEDAAQEAFIAAWQHLPQLRQPKSFPAWLRRIIFKQCDRITRRPQHEATSLELVAEIATALPGPAQQLEINEWRLQVAAAIGQLPETEQHVITLYYFGGMPQAAMASFLEIPESTVKSRLFSARKKLERKILIMLQEPTSGARPSETPAFTRQVMRMIRPTDQELDESGGGLGCPGADIWAMMMAAVDGDTQAIRELLARAPKLAEAQYWYTPPLHYAVREGHLEAVKLLVEAGADPTFIRYGGEDLKIVARDRNHHAVADYIAEAQTQRLGGAMEDHAIHTAISEKDVVKVRELLASDPSLANRPDGQGRHPLHLAAAGEELDIATAIIDAGADLEARTGANNTYLPAEFTPLDFAVWGNDWWINPRKSWNMAELLLQRGAAYSIAIAAARGDAERVETLLAEDPTQVDRPQPCGRRALSAAIQFGHLDLAKRLLQAGANPSLPEGRYVRSGSALFWAARNKNYDLVELLLAAGADPNSGIDSCGNACHTDDAIIKAQLYRYGLKPRDADPTNVEALAVWAAKDPEGLARAGCGTVFTMIVKNEWFEDAKAKFPDEKKEAVLRMLLGMGVKVPPVVTGCATYLWHKPKFTRILLENGMDPNLPDWQLVTPLHAICDVNAKGHADENRVELLDLFLEFGADIDARDEEYRSTPLGWAARNGLQDMVELLLERGAKVSLPDDEPWATPLAWAEKRGHEAVRNLLKRYSAT